jgi:hypothetical protein
MGSWRRQLLGRHTPDLAMAIRPSPPLDSSADSARGGVGGEEANARLTKMSVIENTIPKTIPVTTVFMEGSLIGPNLRNMSNACLNS